MTLPASLACFDFELVEDVARSITLVVRYRRRLRNAQRYTGVWDSKVPTGRRHARLLHGSSNGTLEDALVPLVMRIVRPAVF